MKNIRLLVLGATVAVAAAVGIVLASGGFSGGGPPTGLAEPTATPDTGAAVDPQLASNELTNVSPGFAAALQAVDAGDVDSLLKLVDWSSATCGAGRGSTY